MGKLLDVEPRHQSEPSKGEEIDHMQPPMHLNEAQCLTECMAALGRFISKLGERGPLSLS